VVEHQINRTSRIVRWTGQSGLSAVSWASPILSVLRTKRSSGRGGRCPRWIQDFTSHAPRRSGRL